MMNRKILLLALLFFISVSLVSAQDTKLAATMEVLRSGVEVMRVNTSNWVAIRVEAVVGVGDRIRTNANGRARITFFANGLDVELEPNTEYVIEEFAVVPDMPDAFRLITNVILGQTRQRIMRALDQNSTYSIQTPGMSLAARGTVFDVRVEGGTFRSAMIVSEGIVAAGAKDTENDVPDGFGVRSEVDEPLSAVVPATSFAELDAALDGCAASITTPDDVSINVRQGPDLRYPRVGLVTAEDIQEVLGVSRGASGTWYRIHFRGNFAWILSSNVQLSPTCGGLRSFSNDTVEDPVLFEPLDEDISPESLINPETDSPTDE